MPRENNDVSGSNIAAIYPYPGSFTISLTVAYRTSNGERQETLEGVQIADFLNHTTDIENGGENRTISKGLEKIILRDTDGTLSIKGGKYVYFKRENEKSLEQKSTSLFSFPSISTLSGVKTEIKSSSKYWWEKNDSFEKIVDVATDVLKSCPNSRIYSLGQSPAWIVKAMGMIADLTNETKDLGFIPFSGSFLNRKEEHSGSFYIGDRPFPSKQEQLKYREVLSKIGLSPSEIILKAKKWQKTTILEYTNSGESVASFALMLFSWAKEEGLTKQLGNSLEIVTFARHNSLPPVTSLSITPLRANIKCKNIYADNELLVGLANGKDEGSVSDRLVPIYRHQMWNTQPKLSTENELHIERLTKLLQSAVSQKIKPQITVNYLHEAMQIGASPLVSEQELKSRTEAMRQRESKSKESGVNLPLSLKVSASRCVLC